MNNIFQVSSESNSINNADISYKDKQFGFSEADACSNPEESTQQASATAPARKIVKGKPAKEKSTSKRASKKIAVKEKIPQASNADAGSISSSLSIDAGAVKAVAPTAPISASISSLRLDKLGYGETFPVKKQLVSVPVKKPSKSVFVRVRDGEAYEFAALVLERKEENETYVVSREIAELVPGMVRAVMLYLAVDRKGNPVLIPVPLPDETGRRNNWHESLLQGVILAKSNWVRIVANMPAGCNDVLVAQNVPDSPYWPEQTMEQLVEIAFRGKVITDANHPVVQCLLGLA